MDFLVGETHNVLEVPNLCKFHSIIEPSENKVISNSLFTKQWNEERENRNGTCDPYWKIKMEVGFMKYKLEISVPAKFDSLHPRHKQQLMLCF